jgi:hypothetical protein
MTDSTQQLIDRLHQDKRWWRQMSIGFMIAYAITMIMILAGIHIAFKPGASPAIEALVQQIREQSLRAEKR